MSELFGFTRRLWNADDGATAIEYGLLAALIAVAIIAIVNSLGESLNDVFSTVNTTLVAEAI